MGPVSVWWFVVFGILDALVMHWLVGKWRRIAYRWRAAFYAMESRADYLFMKLYNRPMTPEERDRWLQN